jgi:hypothetical protein
MDEFAYHTPGSKAGILAMRAMEPERLLELARADEWRLAKGEGSPEALKGYVDVLAATGPGTNPTWVTCGAAEEAYGRGLMEPEEMDRICS